MRKLGEHSRDRQLIADLIERGRDRMAHDALAVVTLRDGTAHTLSVPRDLVQAIQAKPARRVRVVGRTVV